MPSLVASYEPAWCPDGLASPAVHVRLQGLDPAAFLTGLGVRTTPLSALAPDLLRIEPSVSLTTFGRLLAVHGWQVTRQGSVLRAHAE